MLSSSGTAKVCAVGASRPAIGKPRVGPKSAGGPARPTCYRFALDTELLSVMPGRWAALDSLLNPWLSSKQLSFTKFHESGVKSGDVTRGGNVPAPCSDSRFSVSRKWKMGTPDAAKQPQEAKLTHDKCAICQAPELEGRKTLSIPENEKGCTFGADHSTASGKGRSSVGKVCSGRYPFDFPS